MTEEAVSAGEVRLSRLFDLPPDRLAELVAESGREGHALVARLVSEWDDGSNRFDRPGEALFAASVLGRIVGVCGLNVDPYAGDDRTGRVRHLYVAAGYRRRGIGRRLVGEVVRAARDRFDRLRLRTDSESATVFYDAIGFRRADAEDCTHVRELPAWSAR